MKKIFAFVLALYLLLSFAIAEDVSSMTDAELKELYMAVKEELMARKLWDESILPAGMYQAGKGLPEGTYECIAKKKTRVVIYKDMKYYLDNTNNQYFYPEEGESFTMALYGEVVYFIDDECIVRPFVGLSW